jgi:hypothetical protein
MLPVTGAATPRPDAPAAQSLPASTVPVSTAPASQPAALQALQTTLAHIAHLEATGVLTADLASTARDHAVTRYIDAGVASERGQRGEGSALLDLFAGQEERRLHPWRATQQRHIAERDTITAGGRQQIVANFAEVSRQLALTPEDAWILHLLLFADEAARLYAAALVLRYPTPAARFERFNLAAHTDAPFITANGDAVAALAAPLFPADPAFGALNLRMTAEARAVTGGEPGVPGASLFRRPTAIDAGEYLAPLIPMPDGTHAIDMTAVEQAYLLQTSRLEQIEALLRRVGRNVGRGTRVGRQPPQQQQQRRRYEQPWRGRPRGGGDPELAGTPPAAAPAPQSGFGGVLPAGRTLN